MKKLFATLSAAALLFGIAGTTLAQTPSSNKAPIQIAQNKMGGKKHSGSKMGGKKMSSKKHGAKKAGGKKMGGKKHGSKKMGGKKMGGKM